MSISAAQAGCVSLTGLTRNVRALRCHTCAVMSNRGFCSGVLCHSLVMLAKTGGGPVVTISTIVPINGSVMASRGLRLCNVARCVPCRLEFTICGPSDITSASAVVSMSTGGRTTVRARGNRVMSCSLHPAACKIGALAVSDNAARHAVKLGVSGSSASLRPVVGTLRLSLATLNQSGGSVGGRR